MGKDPGVYQGAIRHHPNRERLLPSIPMPLGFQFPPNIGRLAVEMAVHKDKTAGKQMVALFQVLADAFNPMGGSSPPMQIAAPTVLDPFVALAQNKDWTGKPIFIENRNSLDPKPGLQRSKDSATPWAKGVAEAINAITGGTKYTPGGCLRRPDQIDFVIGQLTGGIGREAGKVAATATAPFTERSCRLQDSSGRAVVRQHSRPPDSLISSTRTSRRPTRWRMRSKDG